MKRWINYIVLLVFCAGCNMELLPETEITEDDILKDVIDVRKCFMDAYKLDDAISAKIDCDRGLADEMVPNFESLDQVVDFYESDAAGMYRNQNVQSLYAGFYASIAVCNLTLEQLTKCEVSDSTLWRQIQGEALALRAFDHFMLVNYFARPYTDRPETNPGIVLKTRFSLDESTRTTVKAVYDTIVNDLNRARKLMTLTDEQPARFTEDGATALLCRVYLFMNDWDRVIEEADKLIGNYDFPADPYGQFNDVDGDGEIFTLDFSYNEYGFYYPNGFASGQFMDAFHEGDYRSYYLEEDSEWVYDYETGGYIEIPSGKMKWNKIGLTYKALRIAEVYLNRAEAYCELEKYDLARADLLEVASRSGADVDYINDLTGEDLLNEILQERRREFAGEGYRASDLLRKGLPVVRYYREDDFATENPVQTLAPDYFSRVLPIPHRECYLNTLIDQNPGYPRDTKL